MITIHQVNQRSAEWHLIRQGKVTGSNAHILLTKGLEEALKANEKRIAQNWYMKRGQTLEPEAIEIYEKIKDVDVQTVGFVTNSDYKNAGASPDGVVGTRLLEVKCFNASKQLSIGEDNIPFEVMAQLQFNMMICELEDADLILYNPDLPAKDAFKIITVPKNYMIIQNIERKLNES